MKQAHELIFPDPIPPPAPTPPRIDSRMLQFRELNVLMEKGKSGINGHNDVFRCEICGRVLIRSTLADANRHCVLEHSINVVQYYKMASERGTGEGKYVIQCGNFTRFSYGVTLDSGDRVPWSG